MSIGRFTRVETSVPQACAWGCGEVTIALYALPGGTVFLCQRCAEIASHR